MWEESGFWRVGRPGVGLELEPRVWASILPAGRNLIFPGTRRIRYVRANKPRAMEMDGDMMKTQSNSTHRLTAVPAVLMLMGVLGGPRTV